MLRGYRRILLAAVAGLILTAAHKPSQNADPKQGTDATAKPPETTPFRAYPNPYSERCYSTQNHDVAELCAEWRAAVSGEKTAHEARRATNWAIIATALSGATLLGLIITICQTSGALGEARRGNLIAMKANARTTRQSIANAKDTEVALTFARKNADAAAGHVVIARETAAHQLRAYIGVDGITAIATSASISDVSWVPQLEWKNVGQTPAYNVLQGIHWRIFTDDEFPDDFDFPDKDARQSVTSLAPSQTLFSRGDEIPISVINRISRGEIRALLWGWIEYSDIFPASPRRRTETAFEIQIEPRPKGWGMAFHPISKHNGMDDTCFRSARSFDEMKGGYY